MGCCQCKVQHSLRLAQTQPEAQSGRTETVYSRLEGMTKSEWEVLVINDVTRIEMVVLVVKVESGRPLYSGRPFIQETASTCTQVPRVTMLNVVIWIFYWLTLGEEQLRVLLTSQVHTSSGPAILGEGRIWDALFGSFHNWMTKCQQRSEES